MSNIKNNKRLKYEESHKKINGQLYKLCNRHNEYFPKEDNWLPCTEEYFYKNKSSGKDGLNTWCKKCAIKKSFKWMKDNPIKYAQSLKKCNARPERIITVREYAKNQRLDGYQKQYQQDNTDKIKNYNYKRAKEKKHEIYKKEWIDCREYFNYQCAYCGISENEAKKQQGQNLHKEHKDDAGANNLSNCIPSCKSCNSKKNTKLFDEWYNENNPVYSLERYNKIYKWLDKDYKLYILEHKPRKPYTKKNK